MQPKPGRSRYPSRSFPALVARMAASCAKFMCAKLTAARSHPLPRGTLATGLQIPPAGRLTCQLPPPATALPQALLRCLIVARQCEPAG
jgi:hypothetical protein